MRILTRYILREVVAYALLGGVLFTFVLFMRYLLSLLEFAVRGSASVADVARVIGYLLPNLLTLTIPMGVLIGILLGLSRLASDSEITAMRASGMGVQSFLRITSIFVAAAWLVGLANSLYIAPHAAANLIRFEGERKNAQAPFVVQPRVFYEGLKNVVLYVGDVVPESGEPVWRHVFLADLTQPATPHIITADQGYVLSDAAQTLHLHLADGTRHDVTASNPNQYDISTFTTTDFPIQSDQQEDAHMTRKDTPLQALSMGELWALAHASGTTPVTDTRPYRIELNRRFSFPTACFVLMLVGVPLGLSSKRGGKGTGFVLTLFLVFLYYFISTVGIALATQGKVSPVAGVWGANIGFLLAGLLLVQQLSRGGAAAGMISGTGLWINRKLSKAASSAPHLPETTLATGITQRIRRALHSRFPLILDEYVMRSFVRNFFLTLATLVFVFLIFTFFELIGDIIRFRTPLVTVGDYLLNLVPYILYNVTPLCSLVAVLITFGTLSRTSELTSMKATGISLYRVVAPILLVAALLSVLLFTFDELYLPGANRRQESLRATIKGKPAQTFLRPDRNWISGQNPSPGEPARIFYYQFFEPNKDVFANLTVFEFRPGTFVLQRRIFAQNAHWEENIHQWVFENGWQRTFNGETIGTYQPFTLNTFPEVHEVPGYFKKEDRPSQEMSYSELNRYIGDLKESGFDTMRLRVQLNHKLAYPLITLIMAILAVPFALSAGKKGSLAGVGAAVGVAIAYWVIAGIFENLGNVNSLPAVLAAWSPDLLFGMVGAYFLLRTPT